MNLRKLIRETLEEQLNKTLVLKENVEVSDELQYHIDNGLTLTDNVFRVYSEKYFDWFYIARYWSFLIWCFLHLE